MNALGSQPPAQGAAPSSEIPRVEASENQTNPMIVRSSLDSKMQLYGTRTCEAAGNMRHDTGQSYLNRLDLTSCDPLGSLEYIPVTD